MNAALASLMLLLLAGPAMAATSPASDDALRDAPPPRIEITPERPRPAAEAARPTGNPLWSIPLRTLTATWDRPIFSPSRRPRAPAVANVPFVARVAPPSPAPPERLMLRLIGTVSGDSDAFAILIETGSNQVIRLRAGDAHAGWLLKSVQGREVTLQKDQRMETLRLPKPGETAGVPAAPVSSNLDQPL